MEVSLDPNMWGSALWKVLTGIAFGLKDALGDKALPGEVVTLFTVLGGVLPCTYCRASYHQFTCELLESPPSSSSADLKELLGKLVCSHMPKFVYDLHNKVNNKLDAQWFSKKVPALAKRLNMTAAALTQALKAERFCEGRRPSWESLERSHAIFSLKCTAPDVMSVLFMLALSYPDYTTAKLSGEGVDTRDPAERRSDFDEFMGALPQVMRQSKCGDDRLADIIENTWEYCTTGECEHDTEHMDSVTRECMNQVGKKRREGKLTRDDMFMLVWVLRARYKEGVCSSSLQVALTDAQAVRARHLLARAAEK